MPEFTLAEWVRAALGAIAGTVLLYVGVWAYVVVFG